MRTTIGNKRLRLGLTLLLGGATLAGAASAGQGQSAPETDPLHAGPARTSYRVINLGAGDPVSAVINASGQVAYSLVTDLDSPVRAWFYDGSSFRDIGTLGGPFARITGLNNVGQVTGISRDRSDKVRSFVWSRRRGMVDLGTLPGADEAWEPAINDRGEVAGYSSGNPLPYPHAFRWAAASGIEDLGAFTSGPDSTSQANALNDDGMVAGNSLTAGLGYHAFAWTRANGMVDIDTLGTTYSAPVAVGAKGQVAGNFFVDGGHTRVFVWTRAGGMRDIGTAGREDAWMVAMSSGGRISGVLLESSPYQRAMTWTRETGLVLLGTLGGDLSHASAANNLGQVVGGALTRANDYHAYVWSAREGMIDLNGRLRNAPASLRLYSAQAISDNGSIVAGSNAGLVLLTPARSCGCAHTVGPIVAADMVRTGASVDASVSFAGENPSAKYQTRWSWGDGSGNGAGNVIAHAGGGSARASHSYTAPGIYVVTANVSDQAGNSAVVSRKIVVYDTSQGFAAGAGAFLSPHLPNKHAPLQAGMAAFSFIAPSMTSLKGTGVKGQLHFNVGGFNFISKEFRPTSAVARHGQYSGSGTVNGAGNYQFSMTSVPGKALAEGPAGRFSLKIWHIDPATRTEVVDYDNGGSGFSATGDSIVSGSITVQ